jgi:hypothetical protein
VGEKKDVKEVWVRERERERARVRMNSCCCSYHQYHYYQHYPYNYHYNYHCYCYHHYHYNYHYHYYHHYQYLLVVAALPASLPPPHAGGYAMRLPPRRLYSGGCIFDCSHGFLWREGGGRAARDTSAVHGKD